MKLSKLPCCTLLLLISIFSIGGVIRPNLYKGMKSSNGSASQLNEINCMLNSENCLHKAAWYQDRDNSMSPVSTKSGVGAAMVILMTQIGVTQGIQVCPGVYLATAHGVLDNPNKAKGKGPYWSISGYPRSRGTKMALPDKSTMISPRLRDPSLWNDPVTDYVFIKVDNPLRSNDFVRPIRSSNQRLIEASRRGEIDIHLYRPQTRFDTDLKGTPDFNSKLVGGSEMTRRYQAPMRVNEPCQTVEGYDGLIGSNCPTEQAISGSSYVTKIDDQDYLVGLHVRGDANSYENFSDDSMPNLNIPSSEFCKDYESVCGEPCVDLDEVLSRKEI